MVLFVRSEEPYPVGDLRQQMENDYEVYEETGKQILCRLDEQYIGELGVENIINCNHFLQILHLPVFLR